MAPGSVHIKPPYCSRGGEYDHSDAGRSGAHLKGYGLHLFLCFLSSFLHNTLILLKVLKLLYLHFQLLFIFKNHIRVRENGRTACTCWAGWSEWFMSCNASLTWPLLAAPCSLPPTCAPWQGTHTCTHTARALCVHFCLITHPIALLSMCYTASRLSKTPCTLASREAENREIYAIYATGLSAGEAGTATLLNNGRRVTVSFMRRRGTLSFQSNAQRYYLQTQWLCEVITAGRQWRAVTFRFSVRSRAVCCSPLNR